MGTKDSGACENLRCSRIKQTILIAAICAVYIVLCLYKIEQIPVGINIDEIGTQIDQYFLATNGTDRYGIQFPVYFINYGGGQNALNQYLCALTIKIFGYSFLQIKLPGIVVNVIGVIYLFKLLKGLINTRAGLIGTAIYAISPYGIMRARTVLESNLALPVMVVAVYYLYRAIIEENDKLKQIYFLISGAIHGIVLYAYIYEQLVYSIYLTQQVIYLTKHRKIKLKHSIIFAQQLILVVQPLILFNIVNIFRLDTIEILGVTFKQLPYYRQGELVQGFTPFELLVQLICFLPSSVYSDSLSYNQQLIGIYYPVSTIIVLVYTIKNWKKALNKEYSFKKIIMFLWLGNLVAQLMQIANCNKLSTSYIMFILLICLQIENLKKTQLKRIVLASYLTQFIVFFSLYYVFYNCSNEDFQVKPYNDILLENKIDYENLMCTEQAQQVAYMRLRNGEKLQVDDFKIANENQQKQKTQEIKNCQYIVNKSQQELIERLDSLASQGKAQSKEYKYYIFYTIYE